jgi:hypothetical protein
MLEGGQRSWKFAVPPAAIGFVAGNARLRDRVADNAAENDITESESLLIGRDFGVGTNIETGPNGSLLVVSLTKGAIFEVFRR